MIENHVTVSEAAEIFGVSRQRMHVLLRDYEVPVVPLSARMSMIKKQDLKRIPKDRPNGKRKT